MIELFKSIVLEKDSREALYMQLYEKLKDMVSKGILLPDFRLPSIRKMAETLDVNQVTVVSAFRRLENEGYIYSRPGSGTYVANVLQRISRGHNHVADVMQDEIYQQDDVSLINNGQMKIDENTINFASATPTADLFPVENFKIVLNEVLERDKGYAFGYQDSQGFFPLRECLSDISHENVMHCNPESIQIISGAQQGIDIISKAFLRQGDYVITENPTYTGAIAVFKSRGAEIEGIEIKKDGLDLNVLEYSLKKYKPKLIYTIPSFQNPTGYSYSNHKRSEILKLADKYNCYIIEDDYVSDLDFEGMKFTSLKSMDKNNRVILIKSFSKIFMPGLRLGFMVVPQGIRSNTLEAKHTTDISTSGLIQRAFDLYIRKGYWDKHFKFMFGIYKDRYFKMIECLDRSLPKDVVYSKPGGGLNFWLHLPYGFPVHSLLKRCADNHVVFAPGKIFYSSEGNGCFNNLRLSFAAVYNEQIGQGIEKFCSLMQELGTKQQFNSNIPIL